MPTAFLHICTCLDNQKTHQKNSFIKQFWKVTIYFFILTATKESNNKK